MCASPARKLRLVKSPARYRYYRVSYYKPQERRSESLNVRITKTIDDGLKDLARLWTHLESVNNSPEEGKKKHEPTQVTISDVVNRLLEVGLHGAFGEFGGRPETEAQWAELLREAGKRVAQSAK